MNFLDFARAVLGPARRLVLVQIDDEERLLLLGEGKELERPDSQP